MKRSLTQWTALVLAAAAIAGGLAAAAVAQTSVTVTVATPPSYRPLASNIIVPQSRAFVVHAHTPPAPVKSPVVIAGVKAEIAIVEQVATTVMEITVRNTGSSRAESEILVPVPDEAAIKGFTFDGAGKEPTAELLRKDDARRIYNDIVARTRDPALLEFVGYNLIRSSVFPVDAGGTQKVRLTYEHLLPADGDRVDYVLPRTDSVDYNVPWDLTVKVKSKSAVATVYSPSHQLEVERPKAGEVVAKVAKASSTEPGAFRLSYLRQREGVTASLMAYPDAKFDGGYFLLLASVPPKPAARDGAPAIKRELTIVIDRSGSMAGEKIKQVQDAAVQIIQGLADGESFNIIDYSDNISSFANAPVERTAKNAEEARHYLRRLQAAGGTNLHDALLEALRPKPVEGALPIVLFLTDGLPTVGVRDEVAIRTDIEKANKHRRRIFTFGVGYDVNAPLLSRLAERSRATSTFVLPNEDVEVKVSQVYKRLTGPTLADPVLEVLDGDGKPSTRRVADLMPGTLPDLFEGDNLVVLGKYKKDEPLTFRLRGNYEGKERTFQFHFELANSSTRNGFVPRLWASRKIAYLIEEIRQSGADAGATPQLARPAPTNDPRTKELVDEIVRLSMEFGILTEYTSFLAREGTDLSRREYLLSNTNAILDSRAKGSRVGMGGVNQSINNSMQMSQNTVNLRNNYVDEQMKVVQNTAVQQVNGGAFFRQNGQWVDARVLEEAQRASAASASSAVGVGGQVVQADTARRAAVTEIKPDQVIDIGSKEYNELVDKLLKENRNGMLAMPGEIMLNVDGKNVLVK